MLIETVEETVFAEQKRAVFSSTLHIASVCLL